MNEDLYKLYYNDAYSLLVITSTGDIKKLICPFPAKCLREISDIKIGDTVMVSSIDTASLLIDELRRDIIIFVINEHKIYYWFFKVV